MLFSVFELWNTDPCREKDVTTFNLPFNKRHSILQLLPFVLQVSQVKLIWTTLTAERRSTPGLRKLRTGRSTRGRFNAPPKTTTTEIVGREVWRKVNGTRKLKSHNFSTQLPVLVVGVVVVRTNVCFQAAKLSYCKQTFPFPTCEPRNHPWSRGGERGWISAVLWQRMARLLEISRVYERGLLKSDDIQWSDRGK